MEIYDTICNILVKINNSLWGTLTVILILASGIYLSFRCGFVQFFHPIKILKSTLLRKDISKKSSKKKLSQLQALSTSLAASMGTGNIIGIAAAIKIGGSGAVFWMIFSSIFGMGTAYAENYLGVFYREKAHDRTYIAGPISYIKNAFSGKTLPLVYAISAVACSFGIGNMSQSNSAASALEQLGIPLIATGAILAVSTAFVVFKRGIFVAKVAEKIIPIISLFYIISAAIIITVNSKFISEVLLNIIQNAFGFEEVSGGISGFILKKSISVGLRRGIFTNEAGMGSSVFAHANAENADAKTMGLWAIFEIFVDTILCCTLTALAVLTTNSSGTTTSYTQDIVNSFAALYGQYAGVIVGLSMLIFAFAAIIGWFYYGQNAVHYLGGRKKSQQIYSLLYVLAAFSGCLFSVNLIWELSDIFNALMLFPNLIAVLALSKKIEKPFLKTRRLVE